MSLNDIPVVSDDRAAGPSGNAQAILQEVAGLLEILIRTGDGGIIDLKSLPLSQTDRDWLLETLGRGEVEVSLDLSGRSRIQETVYPGVWWVEHRDENDVRVSEFLEVTYVPELISAHPDDVKIGLDYLTSGLAELTRSSVFADEEAEPSCK